MIASYVGENAEFEQQFLTGELEVELTPQVKFSMSEIVATNLKNHTLNILIIYVYNIEMTSHVALFIGNKVFL